MQSSLLSKFSVIVLVTLLAGCATSAPDLPKAELWSASTKEFGERKMDISLKEVQRRLRSSVVQVDIKKLGSSLGSSMMIACMINQLADVRGGYRYIIKLDDRAENSSQMLIGFMRSAEEKPRSIDEEFPEVMSVIDLTELGEELRKVCGAKK